MKNSDPLIALGWDAALADAFAALPEADLLVPARLAVEHRSQYETLTATGAVDAVLPGTLRKQISQQGDHAAVGDWVALTLHTQGPATIAALLPRRGAFVRKVAGDRAERQIVAANIDLALLTVALDQDFNPRRLERYLAAARGGGATPVVILTKADVCPDIPARVAEAAAVAGPDVAVLACSSRSGLGMDRVAELLHPGQTLVFLGSSGIGKSSLVNWLLGEDRQATQGLDGIGKGRHTTTRRELVCLPSGAILIDTPGMRELQLWEEDTDVAATFHDLEALSADCRFSDCGHTTEPGCAVRSALEDGSLAPERLAAWRKLLAEQEAAALKRGTRSGREVQIRTLGKARNRQQRQKQKVDRP